MLAFNYSDSKRGLRDLLLPSYYKSFKYIRNQDAERKSKNYAIMKDMIDGWSQEKITKVENLLSRIIVDF